jgi:hypothetical protein
MADPYGILAPTYTDQLPALRSQRGQLVSLIEEIRDVHGRLACLDPSEFWNSSAQRAYRERVDDVVQTLRGVLNYLTEAQDQIWSSICRLEAEE